MRLYTYQSKAKKKEVMDFQFLPLSSPFSSVMPMFLSFIMATIIMITLKNMRRRGSRVPPGPTKLPIIGNLHNLFGDSLVPRRLQHLAKKHGPFMHLQLGGISTVVVTSSDLAMDVLKTHDVHFADRMTTLTLESFTYGCTDLVFAPYGEYWRQLKKIAILELLSVKRVESFRKFRQDEVAKMVDSISQAADTGTPVNLTKLFLKLSNNIFSRAAFGVKCKSQERFLVALKEAVELAKGFGIGDVYPSLEFITSVITGHKWKLDRVNKGLDSVFEEIISDYLQNREEKRKEEKEDENNNFLDILFRIKEQGGMGFTLTDDNIKAVILDMFSAGTDTSATTLAWIMSELMTEPETMMKAKSEVRESCVGKSKVDEASISEMKYIKLVIKEAFRLHPPLPFLLPRKCREECEVQGYKIPKNTQLLVNVWAIARDPELWEEPDKFKPERFIDSLIDFRGTNYELMPFGAGRRMCPGVNFGLATVELALTELLLHFDWKMPNIGQDLDMTPSRAIIMSRNTPLFLVPLHARTLAT